MGSKTSFPRIADYWELLSALKLNEKNLAAIVLRSASDDEGVLNVGGRVGAGLGPKRILNQLGNFILGTSAEWQAQYEFLRTGKIPKHGPLLLKEEFLMRKPKGNKVSLEERYESLRRALVLDYESGGTPIVIGGGHDYGYPHIAAAADHFGAKEIGLINVDAHFDLRPFERGTMTSGSPYFRALEEGHILGANFTEFGLQEHCNDKSLLDYAKKKRVRSVFLSELPLDSEKRVRAFQLEIKRLSKNGQSVVVSFDLDALCMRDAPGVSAPQLEGFTAAEFLQMIRICALAKSVVSLGFFEVNPLVDENDRTSKLVAQAIHGFTRLRMG